MRTTGMLVELGRRIQCPVVAIHGDYDAHPSDGVTIPLSYAVKDFRFIGLDRCGHQPWLERSARAMFYNILFNELA